MPEQAEHIYETVLDGNGGFNDMTIARTIAMFMAQIKIQTIECGGVIKFRPHGASTFGGYIYKSGVVMIFNEHTSPFASNKASFKEALKTLLHRTKFGYIPLYKRMERDRAMWLIDIGKTYEEVFGYDGEEQGDMQRRLVQVRANVQKVPEGEMASYVDMRIPFRNSIFQKFDEGETTLWEIARIINGSSKSSKDLANQTLTSRKHNDKLGLPVIYPNFHTFNSDGREIRVPNRCVTLDFDLGKQGIDAVKAERIRAQVSCMPETICAIGSFTKGNFWALCAIGDFVEYRRFAEAVCYEVEKRLAVYQVQIDRSACRIKQARFIVSDKRAMIKPPSSRFFEIT